MYIYICVCVCVCTYEVPHICTLTDVQGDEVVYGCDGDGSLAPSSGGCVVGQARAASVIHQYDRVKDLVVIAQKLYGAHGEQFQTFYERHGLK